MNKLFRDDSLECLKGAFPCPDDGAASELRQPRPSPEPPASALSPCVRDPPSGGGGPRRVLEVTPQRHLVAEGQLYHLAYEGPESGVCLSARGRGQVRVLKDMNSLRWAGFRTSLPHSRSGPRMDSPSILREVRDRWLRLRTVAYVHPTSRRPSFQETCPARHTVCFQGNPGAS